MTRVDPDANSLSSGGSACDPSLCSPRVKERGMGRGTRREGVSSAGLTGRRRASVVSVEKKNTRMARGLGRERERGGGETEEIKRRRKKLTVGPHGV